LETVKISFDIETSDAECPMGVEIWLDDAVLLRHNHVQEKITFSHDISDDDGEHKLRVVISGKTSGHTQVDEAGNIVKDATLQISNVVIDDIDVNQLFLEKCVYTHNFNDTQSEIQDTFHGVAGCNGTISFSFSTPIYLWLLENM
jgi:23S rRNA U2552 (ribose-2'-O)-methylase RlmE/FtsJ